MSAPRLTVGITTRDRPQALIRCLQSLDAIAHLCPEVIVFDDASSTPAEKQIEFTSLSSEVRVLRDERAPGYIAGRNRLVREALAPAVLLLDDDAALLRGEAIDQGLRMLESDSRIAAVAFAQADRHGTPWNEAMQPGRSRVAAYVQSFIGFAHLLRREAFLSLSGYRESFKFYGEEKDFCLRLIEAGYRTVYLPDALVMHEPDAAGRDGRRYLRYVTRNDCLGALYNEPLQRLVWMLPARFLLYFRMRRAWSIDDSWGWLWVTQEVLGHCGSVWRDRRPVSSATLTEWKRLRDTSEANRVPAVVAASSAHERSVERHVTGS